MKKPQPSVLAIIPARLLSTRFPKKVLAPILGKPMISYVWENACASGAFDKVIVGTDSTQVVELIEGLGGCAVLTPDDFSTGTDRVAWVAQHQAQTYDWVVNIQADEPLLGPSALQALVKSLRDETRAPMVTLATPLFDEQKNQSEHVVKVEVDKNNYATLFFRKPAPELPALEHIGIYAYQSSFLASFVELAHTPGEDALRLEQLRALDNNHAIKVVFTDEQSISVDVVEDLLEVENFLKNQSPQKVAKKGNK